MIRSTMWPPTAAAAGRRAHSRLRLLTLLWLTAPGVTVCAVSVQLLAGLLPLGFIVTAAAVVGRLPEIIDRQHDLAAEQLRGPYLLLGSLLIAQQLITPVQGLLGEMITTRVDDRVRDRLMAASLNPQGLAHLEDQATLDPARSAVTMLQTAMWTPGSACAGLVALVSRYVQALGGALIVGCVYSAVAGVAVAMAGLLLRFGYRIGFTVFNQVFRIFVRERRLRWYLRQLLLQVTAGKEMRLLGALSWWQARYQEAAKAAVMPVWQARRRVFLGPYVACAACGVALFMTVFTRLGLDLAGGVVSLGAAALVVQASFTTARIGGYIAESDNQVESGLLAFAELELYEGSPGLRRPDPASGSTDPAGLPAREIRFEKVTFGYSASSAPVLEGLDLVLTAGRSTAIVGINGAGKSTAVKLLARLYEPQAGRITVDGTDLSAFEPQLWQRRIGAIFQDFIHYESSLADNVGLGAVELSDDRALIERALRRAGAQDIVDALPDGLDTILAPGYSGGTELSGGQWQRVAIARAFMAIERGAGILILDEPTASLDVRAETEFFDRFLELTEGLTTVVISHRLSTVRRADQIVVLDGGRIIEMGNHDELISREGQYAEVFNLQSRPFEGVS